ncbi:MAG: metal ABC transporter ATP-binding protein [Planctomycetaceae bacterium]
MSAVPPKAASSGGPAVLTGRVSEEHPRSSPLSIHDMTVAYHRRPVLWDIDYNAPPGNLIAIVGPNGAGKSTLIKAVLGLVPTVSGHAAFFGETYHRMRMRVGYVPQRSSVDWDFPVCALEVVTMGLYRRIGWFRPVTKKYRQRAMAALDRVGMADYAMRQISELSGGQQQRVFLARALVQEADLYLMDEPFAGVDAATERAIVAVLRELRETGRTAMVVHHDLQTVPEYFDEVLLLNMRLIATGTVESVFTEENLRATYGGKLALLDRVGHRMTLSGGRQ